MTASQADSREWSVNLKGCRLQLPCKILFTILAFAWRDWQKTWKPQLVFWLALSWTVHCLEVQNFASPNSTGLAAIFLQPWCQYLTLNNWFGMYILVHGLWRIIIWTETYKIRNKQHFVENKRDYSLCLKNAKISLLPKYIIILMGVFTCVCIWKRRSFKGETMQPSETWIMQNEQVIMQYIANRV
jgi:hypothetical protein